MAYQSQKLQLSKSVSFTRDVESEFCKWLKGEIAGNVPCQGIVNQVEAQRRVILEVLGRAAVLFPEPPPLDRIMTA